MANIKTVIFNEGEPLDPVKLKQLNDNILEVSKSSDNLFSQLKDGQTVSFVPRIYAGKIDATNLERNSPKQFNLDLGTGFEADTEIFITATPRGRLNKNEQISITIYRGGSTAPTLYVHSNDASRDRLIIDFIAVQMIQA